MKLKRTMAMMSHLSDVQEMIYFENQEEQIRMRINFVKMLIKDERDEMTEDELNEVWQKCNELYGK